MAALEAEITALEDNTEPEFEDRGHLEALYEKLEVLRRRQEVVGYIDPVDVRYRQRQPVPKPNTKAVMFCLMDVSGSMGEREKDLVKRFFVLLHLFLKRRYEHINVVFIRHTHEAQEVDEETFFYSRQSGGTEVSTALTKMMEVVRDRYPTDAWDIYAAQASDGENFSGDSKTCFTLLAEQVLPVCQYYVYVEFLDEREFELFGNPEAGAALWRSYRGVASEKENFATKRVTKPGDTYPVFRELFLPQIVGREKSQAEDIDTTGLLYDGANWNFRVLSATYDAIERVALDDLGLNVYPNQVEIISTKQMLDAYSSFGMPLMYRHWSFGKHFARGEKSYRQGHSGLAYEIVINSNPCISYNMEDKPMPLQTLVMAHAAFGNNHFFKNNYLFVQWTDADGVLDYFQYAKKFISEAEERHGFAAVEETLDSAHAIMDQGVFRYRRAPELTSAQRQARKREIEEYRERTFNDLWRTVPESEKWRMPPRPKRPASSGGASCACRKKTYCSSWNTTAPFWKAGSGRFWPSCVTWRSIFIPSAKPR